MPPPPLPPPPSPLPVDMQNGDTSSHTLEHVVVGVVGHSKDVGGHLCPPPSPVHVDHCLGVDGEHPVGVDGNTEQA